MKMKGPSGLNGGLKAEDGESPPWRRQYSVIENSFQFQFGPPRDGEADGRRQKAEKQKAESRRQ
jgi:hypothetical protein